MMERLRKPLHTIAVVAGRLIAVFTVGFVCLFALFLIAFLNQDPAGSGCLGKQPYQNQTIERYAHFKIPKSARNVTAITRGFQDCDVYVAFNMDRSDLNAFLGSTIIDKTYTSALSDTADYWDFYRPDGIYGWKLDPNKQLLIGHGSYGGATGIDQSVVIDTVGSDSYVVYLLTILL